MKKKLSKKFERIRNFGCGECVVKMVQRSLAGHPTRTLTTDYYPRTRYLKTLVINHTTFDDCPPRRRPCGGGRTIETVNR